MRRRQRAVAASIEQMARQHPLQRAGERSGSLDVRRTAVDSSGNPIQIGASRHIERAYV
ncbi:MULTISPECIES: hypothetical protein [Burkholderia]|uniref:hypothetical protein n=1 Tax=Burkholderia TaxID=32008 RepID=UPI001CF7C3FB|nr:MULTISPECIES: hypothetical protein [Burkholderia]